MGFKILFSVLLILFSNMLKAQYQGIPFEDDFESNTIGDGWVSNPGLEGDANGVIEVVTRQYAGGQFGLRMGKKSDGGFTLNALDLYLDLSDKTQVFLEFSIMSIFDETHLQDGLWFSDDGGATFVKVYDFKPGFWCGGVYGEFPPFDVDQLALTAGLELSPTFVIRWQQYGNDDFSGGSASVADGFYLDNVKVYESDLTYATLPFEDDFEIGVLSSSWKVSFAQATSLPAEDVDNPMGKVELFTSGNNSSIRLGKHCDQGQELLTANALDLHLDLSNKTEVFLEFSIRSFYDETHFQDGLWFSDDGGATFVKVYDFKPGLWCSRVYGEFPPFDVDQLALAAGLKLSPTFVIRWQQYGNDDFSGGSASVSDGIYLDNVKVYESDLTYATLPFEDDFEIGVLSSSWKVGFAQATSLPAEDVDNPMGKVELFTSGNNSSIRLGKHCDQGQELLTANALDLHLDLSNKTEVFLEFSIRSLYDETHFQDGLWFSDDGGATFVKVYDFKPGLWCSGVYGEFPPFDVDQLALAAGLKLSPTFVIRWQQYGNDDFSGGSASVSDGIYLDNVKVYESDLTYATLPFKDDFEIGVLSSSWKVGFAQATSLPAEDVDNPMGQIIVENVGSDSQYSVRLGKRCDQSIFTSNVLDLHLNLENSDSVVLEFELFKNFDEPQFQDGIYLSQDGGVSFTDRVFAFNFGDLQNNRFTKLTINLDSLVNNAGIDYSDRFVIRFQQFGLDDFSGGTSTSEDGIRIDNVCVTKSVVTSSHSQFRNVEKISFSPNPVKDLLHIINPSVFDDYPAPQIRIMNSTGRIFLQENKIQNRTINVSHLSPGAFFVLISNGRKNYIGSFIKS